MVGVRIKPCVIALLETIVVSDSLGLVGQGVTAVIEDGSGWYIMVIRFHIQIMPPIIRCSVGGES